MMQERNTYKESPVQSVPLEIIKRYVLNRLEDIDEQQLTRVYELVSGNTCLQKGKNNCVNILVNKEHNWN
jgi:hypothetical protein